MVTISFSHFPKYSQASLKVANDCDHTLILVNICHKLTNSPLWDTTFMKKWRELARRAFSGSYLHAQCKSGTKRSLTVSMGGVFFLLVFWLTGSGTRGPLCTIVGVNTAELFSIQWMQLPIIPSKFIAWELRGLHGRRTRRNPSMRLAHTKSL